MKLGSHIFIFLVLFLVSCSSKDKTVNQQDLAVSFDKKNAIIEIGSPFVGIEMHNSSPLLNRLSFYYPVANSIDLSEDYWTRDQWKIFGVGIKQDDQTPEWIGSESLPFELTPYSVRFFEKSEDKKSEINYQFCDDQPAMVVTLEIENISKKEINFEVFTKLPLVLKTCHTYTEKLPTDIKVDSVTGTLSANFNHLQTQYAQLFITNAGLKPDFIGTNFKDKKFSELINWIASNSIISVSKNPSKKIPIAFNLYSKKLRPGEKFKIVQIIGSCRKDEGQHITEYLIENYKKEVQSFEAEILKASCDDPIIQTGKNSIDHSVKWARAILAVNQHFIDDHILPMPCPAQYNFFFTHDVLLTDLAAVHFDIDRVKRDLLFIYEHANENDIIPHAYYWKDTTYVTEYAGIDNWNHFWFIILASSYLRHSDDVETLEQLFPVISTSLNTILKSKGEDHLMWSHQPDWWDIGKNIGPRAYMTILACRTLRDYVYLTSKLGKNIEQLTHYETLADKMQGALNDKLWDDELDYLINYLEDNTKDSHLYMGSILACHYDLLNESRKRQLVETVKKKLLDEKIGIYTVYPMDFHLLIDKWKFNGKEMGDPYYYINGGVWPHGNAWYAMALKSIGAFHEAFEFIDQTMTVEGIMNSPNGQPAMYEYRCSNPTNENSYGKIDKPQFMWAAGWYLYSLYQLLGIDENDWNIALNPVKIKSTKNVEFQTYHKGKLISVKIQGEGKHIREIYFDDTTMSTSVIPDELNDLNQIKITLGFPDSPYIYQTNSALYAPKFNEMDNQLYFELSAFRGHNNQTALISPYVPKTILIDNKLISELEIIPVDNIYRIKFSFIHRDKPSKVAVMF